jgi:TolA-binding protein
MNGICLGLALLLMAQVSFSADKETKGLLPELQINSTDENVNQKKAVESEVLITKTENQAIQALMKIIKKRKGTPQEPELWDRLAELYMRRAKSGRFFDLNRGDQGPVRFAPPAIRGESAAANLRRAVEVYTKIEREFPKFEDMDEVLFNNAFASQQLGLKKNAEALYIKVLNQHPRSALVPDSLLALGEMSYDDHKFADALEFFIRIEKYPESRVYTYGMYKAAWAYYNRKDNDNAINKLVQVVKLQDPAKGEDGSRNVNLSLRGEALRDLAIFYGETRPASDAYNFFHKIASTDEVGEAMINLGKLYDSHSRFKEMNIFLADFIDRQPTSKYRIKAEILMINGNETARDRGEALKHIISANDTCKADSKWRKANASIAESECDYDFAKVNIEIAKKWWELWQKNKQAKEAAKIADYTQQAFKLHLDREDPKKPDTKSHYAYAELLFQLGDYRTASKEYEFAGAKSVDTKVAHDSTYSAIVALEKGMDKKKDSDDHANIIRLSQAYLQKYPKGEHATALKFKIGFTNYEDSNFAEAEKWLRPLAADPKSGEFKKKSEDLILDILNGRKDYAGIKVFSKDILGQTKDASRQVALTKIMQEADYAEIQNFAKSGEKTQAAEKLYSFFQENKTSPLAKDSLWQAMSLYYSSGLVIDGADLAIVYAKAYPDDPRSIDALKDAAKNYADNGFLAEAASTLQTLTIKVPKDVDKNIEAASELYLLDGNIKAAQASLNKLLAGEKNQAKQAKIISKIMLTMKGQESSADYKKLEQKLMSLGQEPYVSQIKIKRVEDIYNSGKLTEAFNAAKPLVGDHEGMDDDVRARARLIQAKILEKEFIETRTKTTLERLSTVLSIKTEKLDKAQTAYLTAAKIAKDPNIKLEALQGLNRIYTNYVDTVGHPAVKDDDQLNDADKKALSTELAKLTAPILEKKIDTDKQLKSLARDSKAAGSNEVDYSSLPVDQTVVARIKSIPVEQLKPYLPSIGENLRQFSRDAASGKCTFSETDKVSKTGDLVSKANRCVQAGNSSLTEKFANLLARRDPKSPLGVYYMSYVAEIRNQTQKATWLMDLALKKAPDIAFLQYQKARTLYHEKAVAEGNAAFAKASELGMKSPELTLIHGVVSYAQGDCAVVIDDFGSLDRSWLSKFELIPALSECKAQQGEFDKAMSYAEDNLKGFPHASDIWLEIAHIQESYRFDSKNAITAYESALKSATQADMKDWITRKIQFLKSKQTVSVLENQHVSGQDFDGGQQ